MQSSVFTWKGTSQWSVIFYADNKTLCVKHCVFTCSRSKAPCADAAGYIDASVQMMVPTKELRLAWDGPLFNTLVDRRAMQFVWNKEFCNECVKYIRSYARGPLLPNVVDVGILDFLIGVKSLPIC